MQWTHSSTFTWTHMQHVHDWAFWGTSDLVGPATLGKHCCSYRLGSHWTFIHQIFQGERRGHSPLIFTVFKYFSAQLLLHMSPMFPLEFKRKEIAFHRCGFFGLFGCVLKVVLPDVSPVSVASIFRGRCRPQRLVKRQEEPPSEHGQRARKTHSNHFFTVFSLEQSAPRDLSGSLAGCF